MLGSDSGRPMASPSDHRSGVWMPASRSAGPEGGQGRRFSGGRHGEQHNSHRGGWPADVGVGDPRHGHHGPAGAPGGRCGV